MAEIASDVFDILHPTPVPLRELSAIVISLEIWRCEINKYRSSNTLKEFRPAGELISLKTIFVPDLPSVIYPMIDKYVKIFGDSMEGWLERHYGRIFEFQYDHKTCILESSSSWFLVLYRTLEIAFLWYPLRSILEYFEDFVCDYDGGIHYGRTAQRMMCCDRFDPNQKFLIACTYCFEDHIRQFYPLLSNESILPKNSTANRLLIYWTVVIEAHDHAANSISERMFDDCMPHNGLYLEYFWNRIPPENRLQKAIDVFVRDLRSFVRYILPKLNRQQLDEFLNEKGCELMYTLLEKSIYDEEFVLRTWAYVQNAMSEIVFTNLLLKILQYEFMGFFTCYERPNFFHLCFEVWNSTPETLKRSAVEKIASTEKVYEDNIMISYPPRWRELKFMLAILSYATYEQRNAFWHNVWHYLIFKIRGKDLHEIMKLCFQNEDEITEFKTNVMANNHMVLAFCGIFLDKAYFNDVNDFVSFLLLEIETARNFKQKLLRLMFPIDGQRDFDPVFIRKSVEFDEFISGAYNDVDAATNFKNQLTSSPLIQNRILANTSFFSTEQLIKFTDLFVSNEEFLLQIETRIADFSKKRNDLREST